MSLKNTFLSPKEQEIQGLAYYGHFFADLDFDDGFKLILLPKLFEYLSSVKIEGVEIEQSIVEKSTELFKNRVDIILKSQTLTLDSTKTLADITTRIQREFLLTPLFQRIAFCDRDGILPIEVSFEGVSDDIKVRQTLQKAQREFFQLKTMIESLLYRIGLLEKTEDSTIQAFVKQWKNILEGSENRVEELGKELENLVANLYLQKAAQFSFDTKPFQLPYGQGGVFGESMKGGDGSQSIFTILQRMDILQNGISTQLGQMREMIVHSSQPLRTGEVGLKQESEKLVMGNPILTDIKLDKNDKFKSAEILGSKQEVYHDGDRIHGFVLGDTDQIRDIRDFNINSKGHIDVFRLVKSNTQSFYRLEGGQYKPLKIEEREEFQSINTIQFDRVTGLPLYGYVETAEGKAYFYTIGEKRILLKIEGAYFFHSLDIEFDKDGTPLNGIFSKGEKKSYFSFDSEDKEYKLLQYNGSSEFDNIIIYKKIKNAVITSISGLYSLFYPSDGNVGKKKLFTIGGRDQFKSIEVHGYESGKPKEGIFETERGKSYFYDYDKIFSFEGASEFEDLEGIKRNHYGTSRGYLKFSQGRIYFYESDKLLVYKRQKYFKKIYISSTDEDGKPTHGCFILLNGEGYEISPRIKSDIFTSFFGSKIKKIT